MPKSKGGLKNECKHVGQLVIADLKKKKMENSFERESQDAGSGLQIVDKGLGTGDVIWVMKEKGHIDRIREGF